MSTFTLRHLSFYAERVVVFPRSWTCRWSGVGYGEACRTVIFMTSQLPQRLAARQARWRPGAPCAETDVRSPAWNGVRDENAAWFHTIKSARAYAKRFRLTDAVMVTCRFLSPLLFCAVTFSDQM